MTTPVPRYPEDAKKFRSRIDKLGFNQTEMAILMGLHTRSVNYYCNGLRRVTPAAQLLLSKVESTSRDGLCRRLIAAQKKNKA